MIVKFINNAQTFFEKVNINNSIGIEMGTEDSNMFFADENDIDFEKEPPKNCENCNRAEDSDEGLYCPKMVSISGIQHETFWCPMLPFYCSHHKFIVINSDHK